MQPIEKGLRNFFFQFCSLIFSLLYENNLICHVKSMLSFNIVLGQRCSVLQGNVSLTDEASRAVLSTGQIYTITIELEVPESAVNLQVT